MSESGESIELWEAPFFEQPMDNQEQQSLAELQAEARAKGFAEGRAEGLAQGQAEGEQLVARLQSVLAQLSSPYAALESVVTKELADLAMHLARSVVRRELSVDSGHIQQVVEQALDTLYKLDGEVVIFLNPVDAAQMRDFSIEALEGKSWKIVEDDSLAAGGCQVKTPSSFVDASVQQQLETLFDSLLLAQEQDAAD